MHRKHTLTPCTLRALLGHYWGLELGHAVALLAAMLRGAILHIDVEQQQLVYAAAGATARLCQAQGVVGLKRSA